MEIIRAGIGKTCTGEEYKFRNVRPHFAECFRRPRTLRAERRVAVLRFARKQGGVRKD